MCLIIVSLMARRTPMFSHPEVVYRVDLDIAGVSMSLVSFMQWEKEQKFLPFVKSTVSPEYTVIFRKTDVLPSFSDTVIHEDNCYRVHPDGKGGFIRSFFDAPRDMTPYAVAEYDYSNGQIRIDCLPKGEHCVSEIHNSFFHIGFESMLIHKQRLCLHASCVKTPLGGILFSGPSGIGKSTQSELWCKYRGAKLINGDRPILSKGPSGWLAWGSPYAGSSKCHINENCPVTAIVMLRQDSSCSLRKLSPAEAFRAVWSGLTIWSWDKWFVEEASDLALDLIENIPVYMFGCTPDESAVEYLERELRKECCL